MTAGVVTVGGKKYAVGLYWQVSDVPNAAKAAKAAATQQGAAADFFCVRPGNSKGRAAQFGLGEGKLGHAWNMPTAAATLANRQIGSWAGVFVVPEGVWFVEVRDDLIAPEGDALFADEAEAMIRLQEVTAQGGLEKIYAPSTWAIPGAEASSLTSLLSGKADVRLQPVQLPAPVKKGIAAGLVVLLLLGAGGYYYVQMQEEAELQRQMEQSTLMAEMQARQQEEQRRRDEAARLQQEQEAMRLPLYQKHWEQSPRPLDWLNACRQAFDQVPVAPLGWQVTSVSCSGTQVLASWSRTSGPAIVPEGIEVDSTLRSASAHYPLPDLKVRGEELLWPAKAIDLYILHNDWQATITSLPDDVVPPMSNGQAVQPPPWQKRQIRWEVPISPWLLKGPLVDLPGFVVQNLVWQQNGVWQIEGTLYEQRR